MAKALRRHPCQGQGLSLLRASRCLQALLLLALAHLGLRHGPGPCFAAPNKAEPGEAGEDYEAAFKKRLKQVRTAPEAAAPKKAAKKKAEPFLSAAFFEGRAVEPESGKNFLSQPEWKVLLQLVGVLMVVTTVVFAYKMSPLGRGF